MTTLNQARAAVYQRFMDEWKLGDDPLTPFCLGNETQREESEWAMCFVVSLPNTQETLGGVGNRKFKRSAQAQVNVYTRPGEGMERADALVKVAMDMFEGRSLPGTTVRLYEASSAEVGLVDDKRWFLSTVQAFFDYEEIK